MMRKYFVFALATFIISGFFIVNNVNAFAAITYTATISSSPQMATPITLHVDPVAATGGLDFILNSSDLTSGWYFTEANATDCTDVITLDISGNIKIHINAITTNKHFCYFDSTPGTYTLTAINALSTTASQDITIVAGGGGGDTTAPVIDNLPDQTEEATSVAGDVVGFTPPMSHDAVDGDIISTCDYSTGTFPIGVTTVTCSKTDVAGNVATPETFTITVQDTTGPSVTVPANITIEAAGPAVVTYSGESATDIVDGSVTATCTPPSGSTFPFGTTVVTCSATDAHSNTGTNTFTVQIIDNTDTTAPVITLTGANPQTVEQGSEYAELGAIAVDTVDGSFAATPSGSVDTAVVGSYTITYNATDIAGNTAIPVTRTVNVVHTLPSGGGNTGLGGGSVGGNGNAPVGQVLGASTGPLQTEIPGCDTRTTGFSIVTGQSCATNIPHHDGQVLGAEKFIFTQYMKLGTKTGEVSELQKRLTTEGYYIGPIDGKFGPKTEVAVKAYQKANPPLKIDGIVGPKTRAVLNK